jgi:HAAS domain-containing protein
VIPDYLNALTSTLSFDPSLSRRVRQEVEDHLWEAVAADSMGNGAEAERRAIARFGDPHVLAAQFALVSLVKQARRVAAAIILVVAGVFIVMKARVAWYAVTQWTMSDDMRAVSGIVLLIDRYSFWSSVFLGIASFVYITGRRVPPAFYPAFHGQLRRFLFLCIAATGALVVSVISDGLLTALQLRGTQLCSDSLIPIFSMAIEVAFAGVIAFQIRWIARRTTSMASLQKT